MEMKLIDNKDNVGSMLLLLFSLFYLRYLFDIPLDPTAGDDFFTARTLPMGLAIITIVCALVQLFLPDTDSEDASISGVIVGFRWQRTLLLILLMIVYSLGFSFFGFVLATFLFLMIGFYILGERRFGLSFSVAGGLVLFMWGMLTQLFGLYLDTGTLYRLVLGAA